MHCQIKLASGRHKTNMKKRGSIRKYIEDTCSSSRELLSHLHNISTQGHVRNPGIVRDDTWKRDIPIERKIDRNTGPVCQKVDSKFNPVWTEIFQDCC